MIKHLVFPISALFFLCVSGSFAETTVPNEVDVCVYGGTPCGMVAAVTAKQEGKSVLLVEPGRWLGGILGAGIKPLQDCPEPRSVGGLTRKKIFNLGKNPPEIRKSSLDWISSENIPVLYEYRIVSAEKEKIGIKNIRLEYAPPDEFGVPAPSTDSSRFHVVKAKMFIDASYEGDLMYCAKVSYAVGREPRDKFDEAVAGVGPPTNWTPIDPYVEPGKPESGLLRWVDPDHGKPIGAGDDYTQAYNYRFYVTQDDSIKVPIGVPDAYDPKDYELLGRYVEYLVRTHSNDEKKLTFKLSEIFPGWMNGGEYNYKRESLFTIAPLGVSRFYQDGDWKTKSDVWRMHREYLQGIHHFLSTDPRVPEKFRGETARYGLNKTMQEDTHGWPNQLYVRLSRRMQGEALLDLHDVWNKRMHDDSVGLALYGVDTYPVRRYVAVDRETGKTGVATEGNMFVGGSRGTGKPYQIPFGAIVPKREECSNLLVPLCFSSTYIAYASARMEPVFCILGESAAVAACQAIEKNSAVQAIDKAAYRKRLLERKQVLEWEEPEIDKPDWLDRAGPNLARKAKVFVSSQYQPGALYAPSKINDGKFDISNNDGRWVSARDDQAPFTELRFDAPIEVNAFRIISGKVDQGIGQANEDFHLLCLDSGGQWREIEGARVEGNNEISVSKMFPKVKASAFRLVVTRSPENLARVWEWELYRLVNREKP